MPMNKPHLEFHKVDMKNGWATPSGYPPGIQQKILASDLDRERKAITKQWAKREEQIERVMGGTIGMYGDLQGIAGKSLQEIEGLEFQALELDLDPPAGA